MTHYIKTIKQCFTDQNVKIERITKGVFSDGYIIAAKTFNYIPDMKNRNVFTCSRKYYNNLKNNYSVYHGLPIISY